MKGKSTPYKLRIRNKYFPFIDETLKRDNYKCTKCGGIDNLLVHHKDESRKNGIKSMNNDLSNLITLCKPCHAIEHKQTLVFKNPKSSMILELRNNNKTFQEIGNYLGISRQRVHQIINKLGY